MLPFYTYLYETSHAVSPWVEYGSYGLWGQKVKGQGHNARITEKGFWRITASPLHLSSWNFTCSLPMSRVWTLWTLGSKGQRSRSQCKDYWKWFLVHNCFPIWCITWIVWIGCRGGYFVPLGQPHSSLKLLMISLSHFIGIKTMMSTIHCNFCFYAPGLKSLPGASSNQTVCLSISP